MFSPAFMSILVYGALVWCAISAIGLVVFLGRDFLNGEVW